MKKTGLIYLATNTENGKRYIGQTTGKLKTRIRSHFQKALVKKDNTIFHKALRKYGRKAFSWEIVEQDCPVGSLNDKEIFYVKKFETYAIDHPDKGYNLTIGGDNNFGTKGKFHYLNKMTKKEKKEWLEKHRKGKNNPNYGNGQALKGDNHFSKQMTEEEREKWLSAVKGDNNYQKKMTKKQLSKKCWMNKLTENEKQKWLDENLRGENSIFKKRPDLYKGENSFNYGKRGRLSACSKPYIVVFPDGREFLARYGIPDFIEKFSENNNEKLLSPGLQKCANNKKETEQTYKGFGCRHYDEKKDSAVKEYDGETA